MCKYIIVYIDATSPHPYPYIDIYIYHNIHEHPIVHCIPIFAVYPKSLGFQAFRHNWDKGSAPATASAKGL
jgi:hypothetical protein